MKNTDRFKSSHEPPSGGPDPDVSIQSRLKGIVATLSKSARLSSLESLLARVPSLWFLLFAGLIWPLFQEREVLRKAQLSTSAQRYSLYHRLKKNQFRGDLAANLSFVASCSCWERLRIDYLAILAVEVWFMQIVFLAWYVRHFTQSALIGLLFAFPIMFLPMIEAALPLLLTLSERGRKMLTLAQVLVGLLA